MLTEEEKSFIIYWEKHRVQDKKILKQWLVGLPIGILFGLPIVINFFSGWYKRAVMDRNTQISNRDFNPLVLIIAVLLIISFMAIFAKQYRWEMNEQKYKELKAKE
jgi:uncharacterized membrane protein